MLKISNLGKEFKDKIALNDIDLTFPDKGLVIIKGESGSGKTTLLNLLTALDYPTRGKVEFDGVEITPKNSEDFRMRYCGNIYQDYMLIDDLSIRDNIEIALQACGEEYSLEDIKELLKKVDIPQEFLDKKTSKLSGGEKQRIAIARAISKRRAMIFADEPTGNLDSKNGKIIMDLLKDISKERLVIVVSHNEKYNEQYADYTVELEDGVVKFCDLPSQEGEQSIAFSENNTKSKIKGKTMARLAFWGFEKNKVKTVVSMIAFVILAIFSTLLTVAFVGDANLAYTRSLAKCEKKNVFIETQYYLSKEEEILAYDNYYKLNNNIDYPSSNVFYFTFNENIFRRDNEESSKYSNLYSTHPYINQAIIYNPQAGMDVDVLYGDFPKAHNDIMLPYCYAKYISDVYLDFKCDNVGDLVGKDFIFTQQSVFYEDTTDYYTFKICGVFEEGDYYTDYEDGLDKQTVEFYQQTNKLASSVILSPQAQEIMFNNAYIFNGGISTVFPLVRFYDTRVVNNKGFSPYAYDSYSDYAKEYAPLEKGQVYVDKTLAEKCGIKVGDALNNTYLSYHKNGLQELVESNFNGVVVKGIFDLADKTNFIIFSQEDYYSTIARDNAATGFIGYYFNAKNIKNKYAFFNDVLREGSKLNIFIDGYLPSVYTGNTDYTGYLYEMFIALKYVLWLPLMLLSYLGMAAMGFVSFSYLVSAKSKSYNILRSLGFGKKNMSLLLAVQVFSVILIECVLGIFLGWLSGFLLGKTIVAFTHSGIPLSIASEVLLPIGYVAPIVLVLVSIALGGAIVFAKTRALFSKSIMENKTN